MHDLRKWRNEYKSKLDVEDLKSENNGLYIFVVEGAIAVKENLVNKRDAIGIYETEQVSIKSIDTSELIIIEVPMD